ncbi:hypothetical protein [Paenibacillus sp. TC-CSREp1]|uniref:hypothetical protein n=1 Tax=Paenibacillus sp. TC-CSREp1 TaxID=3410089 RepID=UPI003D05D0FD
MNTKKKWSLVVISSIVVVLLVTSYLVFFSDYMKGWSSPSKEQQYYTGTIVDIKEQNSKVDGDLVLNSILLDNGEYLNVTKNSRFYLTSDEYYKPEAKFSEMRVEAEFKDVKVGDKIESWTRQANNHLFEIYELTIK